MSSNFQSGQHPDADQLNAFVEHALSPHEQQAMLAHLAVCPDCRAVAFLAQPPAPKPLPHAAPARTPFFARWMLLAPTAAALACLVILTIHIHNVSVARDKAPAATAAKLEQAPPTAPVTPPTAASPQAQPSPVQPATTPPLAEKKQSQPSLPSTKRPAAATPVRLKNLATSNSPLPKKDLAPALVGTGMAASAPPPAAPAPPLFAAATPASPPAIPPNQFHGGALRSSATQYDLARAQSQSAPPAPAAAAPRPAPNSASGIYGGTGQTNLNENYIEGTAASNPAPPGANNSANAAPPGAAEPSAQPASPAASGSAIGGLAFASATSSDSATAAPAPSSAATASTVAVAASPRPTLPSHLPAVSFATNGRHQLALDSAGSLFRSDDAGATWQPIPALWTGRAVSVAVIPSAAARPLDRLGAIGTPAVKASAPPPAFQLTTDTGAIWLSSDGQTWKQQK